MTTTATADDLCTIEQEPSRFNDEFGEMSARAKVKVKGEMSEFVQKFIQAAPFVVMASSDPEGNCDASPKGGKPGFVKVIDNTRLLMPDVAGNRLFQSYQNMDSNPHVGLLFMIPGVNDTVRVNGTVTIVSKEELERQKVELELYWTDDNSKHLQGVIINVEEAYGHCPRAYNFAKLWDTDQIAENQANRPIPLRP
ncbi:MAG: pyridoxamine 5'-phosphate oxidase family protein [Dehalococcoidia bacterium]|nr:pyridoxamine 5'-phosphate oxidase family protein [Dehalococcoidia bacterium]